MDQSTPRTPAMEFSHAALGHLNETRKWTLFLAIVAMVMMGLLLAGSIVLAIVSPVDEYPGQSIFTLVSLGVAVVLYIFPIYWLFQFSAWSKKAVLHQDGAMLTRAMHYLKLEFRYMGILMIVVLGIYALGAIGIGLAALVV